METVNVQGLLVQLGYTPQELAQRLHVDTRSVIRWRDEISKPGGLARDALLRLQQSLHGAAKGTGAFRVGVCAEFSDTLLPVLTQTTGALTRQGMRQVSFVPMPWERRALTGLHTGLFDVLLFNEQLALEHIDRTAACLYFSGEPFRSGTPYIAFSLPEMVPRGDLLSVLWHPSTVKIVPHADMEVTFRRVREGCRRSHHELEALARQDDEAGWFRCSAGAGVRLFLNPPSFWGNAPIAYIGGQDQRAQIECAMEQPHTRTIVLFEELADGLDVELPQTLRTNRLVSIGRSDERVRALVDAVDEARRLVSTSESVRADSLTELVRWQHVHGSGAYGEFGDTRQGLSTTLPMTRTYSAELGRWFS